MHSSDTAPLSSVAGDPGALYLLVGLRGAYSVLALPPGAVLTAGRSGRCDLVLDDASISRVHLEIHTGPPLRAIELGSANGTRLRGEPLRAGQPRVLRAGDTLTLGRATLLVERRAGAPGLAAAELAAGLAGAEAAAAAPARPPLRDQVAAVERRIILDTLYRLGGNQTRAAALLGISRGTLRARMDAYGIPRPKVGSSG